MKRKVVGTFQFVLGVLLLIAGIIGIIYSVMFLNRAYNIIGSQTNDLTLKYTLSNNIFTLGLGILTISIVCILFSLLFITQGIVNSSENKK